MKLWVFGLLFVLVAIALSSPVPKPTGNSRPFGLLRRIFGLGSRSSEEESSGERTVVPRSRQSRKSHFKGRRFRKCPQGTIPNVAGKCTEPIVERRVYVYNSPSNLVRQQLYLDIEDQIKPRIDYHLVIINKNEGEVGDGLGLGQNLILNEEEFRNSIQNFGDNIELTSNSGLPFSEANHRELLNVINQAQKSQGLQSEGSGFSNGHQAGFSNRGRNLQRYVVVEQSNPRLEDIKGLIREVNRNSQLRSLKERQELSSRLSQNANSNILEERNKDKKFELNQDNFHSQFLASRNLPLALRTSLGNRIRLGSHFESQASSGFGRANAGSKSFIKISQGGGRGRFKEFESETGLEGGSSSSSGSEGSDQHSESSSGSEGSGQEGEASSGNGKSGQEAESSSGKEEGSGSSSGSGKESETEGEQSNGQSGGSESEGKESGSGSKTEELESRTQSENDEAGSKSNTEQTEGESGMGQKGSESGDDQSGSKSSADQSGSESSGDQSGAESSGDQSGSDSKGDQTKSEASSSQSGSESQTDETKSMGDDMQSEIEGKKAEMESSQSGSDDSGSKGDTTQTQTNDSGGEQSETENAKSESQNMQSESESSKTENSESEQGSSKSEGEASESSGSENSESSGNDESKSEAKTSEQQSEASSSSSDSETSESISESENDIESRSGDSNSLNKNSNLYSLSNRRHVIGNESYIKINIASIKDFPLVFVKLNPENENLETGKQ